MTDLLRAKSLLVGDKTCVLVKGEKTYFSTKSGIAPMMGFISDGLDLKGFSVADKIVGKAAAMLFCLAKISCVYAAVLSKSALQVLQENNIKVEYNTLVDKIINRAGTGICPMEEAVANKTDFEAAYEKLKQKLQQMKKITN